MTQKLRLHPEVLLGLASTLGIILVHGTRVREFFWTDEVITARAAYLGWIELIFQRYWAGHSPLYYLILKLYALVLEAIGLTSPTEVLIRVPSVIATGLAGGYFASAAWRAWTPAAGVFFVPLWVINPIVGYYAVEARPFCLLLLALSLTVWSATRLHITGANSNPRDKNIWLVSIISPITAAASIPVGIIAVLAVEISALSALPPGASTFKRSWKKRTLLVISTVALIAVLFSPAIFAKADDYWTNEFVPFSLGSIGTVLGVIALQHGPWLTHSSTIIAVTFGGLLVLGFFGLLNKHDALGRMAAGLAIIFPAIMIVLSSITSLLVPRYFLPAIPGLNLLVVGFFEKSVLSWRSISVALLIVVASALVVIDGPYRARVFSAEIQQQIALLQELRLEELEGGTAYPHMMPALDYYIQKKMHFAPVLKYLEQRLAPEDIRKGHLYWVFDRKNGKGKALIGGLQIICHLALKNSDIYVVAANEVRPSFACSSDR